MDISNFNNFTVFPSKHGGVVIVTCDVSIRSDKNNRTAYYLTLYGPYWPENSCILRALGIDWDGPQWEEAHDAQIEIREDRFTMGVTIGPKKILV
jgi:hypothetical protein